MEALDAPARQATPDGDLQAWTRALFRAIDARDTDGFLAHLTPDARFTFANLPPAEGTAAMRAMLEGFFGAVAAVAHAVDDVWSVPGHVVCRGSVRYTRHDGRTLTLPFCDVLGLRGPLVADYRIYIDASALFAP